MNTRVTKTIVVSLVAISLIAVAIAFGRYSPTQAAPPAQSCGAHTLRGSYVFNAHGWNIVGGVAVPKAIVEGIDFNGDGTLVSPFATVSLNGTILHFGAGSGSYTVNPDCTGTLTFSTGQSFDMFVQPGEGKQVWMIQTGPVVTVPPNIGPPVFEGTATKVSP
ncbi:MAG TPA: hypothetical protein VJM12_02230 [Pyrinomonadaceae bacterium]|nr:hypothetical protein [Pyrinomonadaceae bacterium]